MLPPRIGEWFSFYPDAVFNNINLINYKRSYFKSYLLSKYDMILQTFQCAHKRTVSELSCPHVVHSQTAELTLL